MDVHGLQQLLLRHDRSGTDLHAERDQLIRPVPVPVGDRPGGPLDSCRSAAGPHPARHRGLPHRRHAPVLAAGLRRGRQRLPGHPGLLHRLPRLLRQPRQHLDVLNGATATGSSVAISACSGNTSQQWSSHMDDAITGTSDHENEDYRAPCSRTRRRRFSKGVCERVGSFNDAASYCFCLRWLTSLIGAVKWWCPSVSKAWVDASLVRLGELTLDHIRSVVDGSVHRSAQIAVGDPGLPVLGSELQRAGRWRQRRWGLRGCCTQPGMSRASTAK